MPDPLELTHALLQPRIALVEYDDVLEKGISLFVVATCAQCLHLHHHACECCSATES